MTRRTAIDQRQDGGAAVEEGAWADTAAPHLAAIQHSYEEAKANIVDPARFPSYPPQACSEPLPPTEKIDVRAVKPPVRHPAPGTGRSRVRRDRPGRRRWWQGIRTAVHAALTPPHR